MFVAVDDELYISTTLAQSFSDHENPSATTVAMTERTVLKAEV